VARSGVIAPPTNAPWSTGLWLRGQFQTYGATASTVTIKRLTVLESLESAT